jgi:biopolymer transport protein TolQ
MQEFDPIHMFFGASLMVQLVLLVLIFFSITSWSIIIIKSRYIRRAYRESAQFTEFFWKSRDFSDAFTKAKQLQGSPVARLFRIGYLELKRLSQSGIGMAAKADASQGPSLSAKMLGTDNIKRALRRSSSREVTQLTQMVPFLATTGNTAPFIGLFGTVIGIMNSFHGIGLRGSASLAVVAPGISEALFATAVGLFVAIPAVIAYNTLANKIRVIDSELKSFAADFLNIVERDILSNKGANR